MPSPSEDSTPSSPSSSLENPIGEEEEDSNEDEDEGGDSDDVFSLNSGKKTHLLRHAAYTALANAALVLLLLLLYSAAKLLEEFWRPIQWAVLCSMPLREIQRALVKFWSHPLQLGLFETLLAVPVALFRSAAATVIDSQIALLRILPHRYRFIHVEDPQLNERVGFAKLMEWMVSFGLFVFAKEKIGFGAVPVFAFVGFMAYAAGCSVGFVGKKRMNVAATLTAISSSRWSRSRSKSSFLTRVSRFLTSGMLNRLQSFVAVGLISFMILGSFMGLVFFSYKIGIEGKNAVMSLKTHLQESNYAEKIGISQWIDENDVPEFIDAYTAKLYETATNHIDKLALQHNATDIVDGIKYYLIQPLQSLFTPTPNTVSHHQPFSEKLYNLRVRILMGEWKVIYEEMGGVLREFFSLITREDLIDKIKDFALQSMDVSKRFFASSTVVLAGSANILLSAAVSIISGAAGVLNFISQLMVFFWLLYYFVTSESGGVMDQMLAVLPISKSARVRSAQVLAHAVSSVLLATAKMAFFQGCLTYLLFKFYRIHFVYMSTFIAFISAILPITPSWLASIPAAAQLAMEGRYIEVVGFTIVHLMLINWGVGAIQDDIPGQNSYLTGFSILGGMALLPSALEGAIMGPLLMTVMIALKNLYAEFVLAPPKKTKRSKKAVKTEKWAKTKPIKKSLALNILLTMKKFRMSGLGLNDTTDIDSIDSCSITNMKT